MSDFKFSDAFLETAYRAVMYSQCESEEEKRHFEFLCKVCDKYEIPVKKYLEAVHELNKLLSEDFNDENSI